MRRKQLPGLNVGGTWTLPRRETISRWELAFIIEASEPTLVVLLGRGRADKATVEISVARDLLRDLADCGFADWREASLFGDVIAGRRQIDPEGRVRACFKGRPFGPTLEIRTTNPAGAVELELDVWHQRRERTQRRVIHSERSRARQRGVSANTER